MKQESPFSSDARAIRKTPTQIHGLDAILHGGLPTQRMTLITGGPGTGKSLLGLEFVYRGAVAGEPGIFVTFEESGENVRQNAATLGWDLEALEQSGSLFLLDARVDPEVALSGEFNLGGITAILEGRVREMRARRIVIDAMDGLMRFFEDPNQEQNQLLGLHHWLTERGLTAVFTSKAQGRNELGSSHDFLDFLADCVLALGQEIKGRVATKTLQVIKYRGSPYGGNAYPFLITGEGCRFNPITDMVMHYEAPVGIITSGNKALDAMLGGGYQQGRCVLIAGAPGTGKTTLAGMFVRSACEKGEKVLYVSYEESQADLIQGMRSVRIDLEPALEYACLEILPLMPESTGVEEHLFLIQQAMERLQPDHLVVDAVSACHRMGGEEAAFDFLIRLISTCREQGITAILINQEKGSPGYHDLSGIGLSSFIDILVMLRYREVGDEIQRFLLVLKARGKSHSTRYHRFFITEQGLKIER